MGVAIIKNSHCGKIRSKRDVMYFITERLCCGSELCFTEITSRHYDYNGRAVAMGEQYHIYKDKQGRITATIRSGNLRDMFNPEVCIADSGEGNYALSIEDVIWKLRKQINQKYLSC